MLQYALPPGVLGGASAPAERVEAQLEVESGDEEQPVRLTLSPVQPAPPPAAQQHPDPLALMTIPVVKAEGAPAAPLGVISALLPPLDFAVAPEDGGELPGGRGGRPGGEHEQEQEHDSGEEGSGAALAKEEEGESGSESEGEESEMQEGSEEAAAGLEEAGSGEAMDVDEEEGEDAESPESSADGGCVGAWALL